MVIDPGATFNWHGTGRSYFHHYCNYCNSSLIKLVVIGNNFCANGGIDFDLLSLWLLPYWDRR